VYFWKNIANFVNMKSDITFLPERKQRDLHELVALIREEIRDVVMIILYGSYAKNTYVDLDERHDFGVRTYYMSDYDLLVVTQRRLGVREATVNASRSVFRPARASSRPIRSLSTKVSPNSTMRSPRGDTSMSRS
jgi:tRNA nucleotidyltransferase (CCA-adding enzyme)